tara:strand:- start:997 stop:1758 length:762 start_codon:yes stop_codon:yes gene_type:complete
MVEAWLVELMTTYNEESYQSREAYTAQVHLPGSVFEDLVWWGLQALPDEILVGLDIDAQSPHVEEVDERFSATECIANLFQGQGYRIKEAHIVNRGDSYSVHHLPEDWTDDMFSSSRGSRAGRFTHWLHTHPNAPAIPSGADADAAQETPGIDMILGLRFSPEGPLPWFDDVEGQRRRVGKEAVAEPTKAKRRSFFQRQQLPVLGVAPSGHKIHEIQLIAFHKNGLGINVVLVDEDGYPYGWEGFNDQAANAA